MTCEDANSIPIKEVVETIGQRQPERVNGYHVWYKSPFRDEQTASFRIDTSTNRYKDFGHVGSFPSGRVVDFVMTLRNCTVSEALKIIEHHGFGQFKSDVFSFQGQSSFDSITHTKERKGKTDRVLELLEIKPLKNPALLQFLESRWIDGAIAQKYCHEMYFRNWKTKKSYFAIAFQNDSGAWEWRNAYMKGILGGEKEITTLEKENSNEALVFEGFTDFLSYLTFKGINEASQSVIVLNSATLAQRAVQHILRKKITTVHLYLQNDSTGLQAKKQFTESEKFTSVDQSQLYHGYKDFNDFLQAR